MITRSKLDDAARFNAHADQLRAEARQAESEYDRQHLLAQAAALEAEAQRLIGGEQRA
jgi:hypothetical protein